MGGNFAAHFFCRYRRLKFIKTVCVDKIKQKYVTWLGSCRQILQRVQSNTGKIIWITNVVCYFYFRDGLFIKC